MVEKLRIAVRKFEPFERAIEKQFAVFKAATGCPLAPDLIPLVDALFASGGLKNGDWEIRQAQANAALPGFLGAIPVWSPWW